MALLAPEFMASSNFEQDTWSTQDTVVAIDDLPSVIVSGRREFLLIPNEDRPTMTSLSDRDTGGRTGCSTTASRPARIRWAPHCAGGSQLKIVRTLSAATGARSFVALDESDVQKLLTPRAELDAAGRDYRGFTNKISLRGGWGISLHTVGGFHVESVFRKLGARTRARGRMQGPGVEATLGQIKLLDPPRMAF